MKKSSKSRLFQTFFALIFIMHLFGQSENIAINNNGSAPDSSAILDINSSTKGILIPRLTTEERNDISNPKVGLEIYNLDLDCFEYYNGANWLTNCGFLNDPTMAMAGSSRSTMSDTIHLNANNPGVSENGLWSILIGQGGTFSDITDPNAIFSNNGNFETFLLRWTISNPCGKTYSDVSITFNREGIYVSINGSDSSGDGLPGNPYMSVQNGIDEALLQSKVDVFISEGNFSETLTLDNISNINLIGGHYLFDWNIKDHNIHPTRIQGGETGCFISNSSDLSFDGINLASARSFSGNSIGIDILNSSNITVNNCTIGAENAANGMVGINGVAGIAGQDGGDFELPVPCSSSTSFGGQGGTGGALSVGFAGGTILLSGGNGGAGGQGNENAGPGANGIPGFTGSNSGGLGGAFGLGVGPCTSGTCSSGGHNGIASPGEDGGDGEDGGGGIAGFFSTNGLDGEHGRSGGGGGGGGGCGLSDVFPQCGQRAGNSGSGGGGGGSGAEAGTGGAGGRSSIGIWIKNSTISVANSTISTAYAGSGGNGGSGNIGGIGGQAGVISDISVGYSGPGADGGKGGAGGNGGGGGGGSSICIIRDASSSLTESGNIFLPGPLGNGGISLGISGQDGTSENIVTY